jgi:hypothetical protein
MPAAIFADVPMSRARKEALRWLGEHNGDGLVERWGTVVAAGERAPHTRQTWRTLHVAGLVEIYGPRSRRVRLTDAGREISRQERP